MTGKSHLDRSPQERSVPVHIVPYDPTWPTKFAEEREAIRRTIGWWIEGGIEHVGSTAVPGLAAKPVIDIMAGVRSLAESRAAIGPLAELGYLYAPYRAEVMHWFCKPSASYRTHHLHLVEYQSPRWKAVIGFRDYLRAHPEVALDYEALKQDLAQRFGDDREGYTSAKTAFIERIVGLAFGALIKRSGHTEGSLPVRNCRLFGAGPVLPVRDIASAVSYYCTELGFTLDFMSGNPPTHGSVTRGRVGVQFTPAPDGFQAADYPGWTYIFVEGIDQLFEEYQGRNVHITREITSHEHGMREFEIEDLDGHRLRFGQYLSG